MPTITIVRWMMNQRHFMRIAPLALASILLTITVAVLSPVSAIGLRAESEAERYVLEQLPKGGSVRLEERFPKNLFPEDEFPGIRSLRGSFVASLLTSGNAQLGGPFRSIAIEGATITGELIVTSQEIPLDVYFTSCTFNNNVILSNSHFAKGLNLTNSTVEGFFDLSNASIDNDFDATLCRFEGFVELQHLRVRRNLTVYGATLDTSAVTFESAQVGGDLSVDNSKFLSKRVEFDNLRVDGAFSARNCVFLFDLPPTDRNSVLVEPLGGESKVSFAHAHFGDFFLNDSTFEGISLVDFTRMQADFLSFDGVSAKTPTKINLQRLAFKIISPVDERNLGFLLADFNPSFYSDLEASLRTHGYPNQADNVFIARKRAERRENCKSFLHQCNRGPWALSWFEDMLAGYGKSLQNLLYWSLGFLIIGIFVFRSEKGMRTRDGKDAEDYEGKYNAFWYSLDLFLPIIKLGEADVWTPKDYRRWANLYRRVHIIIGSLFVPIGLAAWTGIIK